LADAFEHDRWATLRLIEACEALDETQLQTTVPGTYGSIIDTMRHLVGGDRSYLALISGQRVPDIDEERERTLDLAALRDIVRENAPVWDAVLQDGPDPERMVVRHRDDGSESHAPLSVRLAQVVHHGSDHRSQVCTALTSLGVEPPEIDVWSWAAATGRSHVTDATS
jgi:uncharacterized damage-inducible protein DinB